MKATPKTKKDLKRLYSEINRIVSELEEIGLELNEVIVNDSNGLSMKSITDLFCRQSRFYLKKVSETLKVL